MLDSARGSPWKASVFLASMSPQRAAILQELKIEFQAITIAVDEVTLDTPEETVQENAKLKALAALRAIPSGSLVIAADTIVFAHGSILGKPDNKATAREYLCALSGHTVRAFSGIAVARKGADEGVLALEYADAQIKALSESEIAWYIETEEPLSRAGAFGISRYGEIFVEKTYGAYSCIAGLPKIALLACLDATGASGACAFPVLPPKELFAHRVNLQRFRLAS